MALRLSTGLRQALLGTADFKTEFTACFVNVYTGSQPSSPDDIASGSLLVTIYSDGTALGLNFDNPVLGVIGKVPAEVWTGTALATGTAGFFRIYEAGTNPALQSSTDSRMDGAVGTTGGELNMSSTAIVTAAVQTITSFNVTLPAS